MIKVFFATDDNQLNDVRKLIREFVHWHRQRHLEDAALIDEYFDQNAFADELATLPGKYSAPEGRLLLGLCDERPAGCVALRKIDDDACEMKRMFVYPEFQGKGVGRVLTERLIDEARAIGYSTMKLDTSIRQTEAQALYGKMGFKRTKAYYDLPQRLADWLVFMELKL